MAIALAIIAILLVSVCSCWDLNGLKTEFDEFKLFATEKFEFLEAENVKKNGEIRNLKEENSKLEKKLQLISLNFQQETSKTQTICGSRNAFETIRSKIVLSFEKPWNQ